MGNTSRRGFLRSSGKGLGCLAVGHVLPWFTAQTLRAQAAPAAGRWPLFRGNARATGVTRSMSPTKLTKLWDYRVENGAFEATPVIADGICYIADLDGTLYALKLADGTEHWKKKTDSFGFAAPAALNNDRLYLGDIDGKFQCFDLAGEVKWSFTAQAEINASANFYKDKVLFGSQDATLYCLFANTGEIAWKIEVQDQIRCSPTVVEDRSFVAGCDGQLHIIDLEAGKELHAVEIMNPTGVTPAALGDRVFFGTEGGDIFCVDWKQPKVIWTSEDRRRREVRSCPAVDERIVVIGNRDKKLYALDPQTGDEKWTFTCKRGVDSSPLILGDKVFAADTSGQVYLLDVASGKLEWEQALGGSFSGSPAVADQRLVIANDDGVVYCFGESAS